MTRTLAHKAEYFWKYLTEGKGFIRSFPLPYFPNHKRPYPELIGTAADNIAIIILKIQNN